MLVRLSLSLSAVVIFALPAAADDRVLWKHDGGTYERVGDKKWVEKSGSDTFEFSELSGSDTEVKLNDRKRDVRVTLKAGVALIFDKDNRAKPREVKGDWVLPEKPAAERVVWKHDKGTFEKTGDKKWVEKRGDESFPLRETFSSSEQVELFDPKRNARVTLKAGTASVQEGKEKEPRVLKGEWVAKADAKPDPKTPPAERVLWKHDKGQFELTGGKWVESVSGRKVEWAEKATTAEYVELYDAAGKRAVRLAAKEATQKPDGERAFRAWTAGGWAEKPIDPNLPRPSDNFSELATRPPEKRDAAGALSPDGKLLTRSTGDTFKEKFAVVEFATGKVVREWDTPFFVPAAAWSADGKTLAGIVDPHAGTFTRRLVVWETAKWQEKGVFELFAMDDTAVAINGDGKFVAASGIGIRTDRSVSVWDVAKKKEVFAVKTGGKKPPTVALSADGKVFAIGRHGKGEDEVGVYDVTTSKPRGAVKAGPDFALSADGGTLAAWTSDETTGSAFRLWDTKDLEKEPRTFKDEKWVAGCAAFADDGRKLVAGVAEAGRVTHPLGVRVYDVKTLAAADTFTFGKPNHSPNLRAWLTPDSTKLLLRTDDGVLHLWSAMFTDAKPDAPSKAKP